MLLSSSSAYFIYLHSLGALMTLMLLLLLTKAKLVLYVYFLPGLFPRLRVEFLKSSFCELEALINKPICWDWSISTGTVC